MVTLRSVREARTKGRTAERYVLPVVISRAVSVYLTYVFIRLRVRPDEITFASMGLEFAAAASFVAGLPLLGAVLFLVAFLFDCSDGEVARVVGRTNHGAALDTMGADTFYAVSLTSIGYYLFSAGLSVGPLEPRHALIAGAGTSAAILLTRVIEIRSAAVRNRAGDRAAPAVPVDESRSRLSIGQRVLRTYRNRAVRLNLFAGPGITFIVLALVASGAEEWISAYLMVLAAYHFPNLGLSFAAVYWTYARRGAPSDPVPEGDAEERESSPGLNP